MRRTLTFLTVAALSAALAAGAAGGSPAKDGAPTGAGPAVATADATKTVAARIRGFAPRRIVVSGRTLVRFRNVDGALHNAVASRKIAGRSAFTSGAPRPGAFSFRAPRRKGTYAYICEVHPLTMRGTVVVRPTP